MSKKIRICWPNPDATCLEGGCIHCQHAEPRLISEVEAYALNQDRLPNRCGGKTVDAWEAYLDGVSMREAVE